MLVYDGKVAGGAGRDRLLWRCAAPLAAKTEIGEIGVEVALEQVAGKLHSRYKPLVKAALLIRLRKQQ